MKTTHDALATQWYEHVARYAPTLDSFARYELEDYFGNVEPHNNVAVSTMSHLFSKAPQLENELTKMLGESTRLAMSTALLWLWCISNKSPSRAPPEVDHLVAKWRDSRPMAFHTNQNRALELLTWALPLAPLLQLDVRSAFFSALYHYIEPQLRPHHRNPHADLHVRTQLCVALGHCAIQAVPLASSLMHWHEHTWVRDLTNWNVGGTSRERELLATEMMESTLPGSYKLRAFKSLDTILWRSPLFQPTLCTLMPEQETRRLPLLAWRETSYAHSGPDMINAFVRSNQAMVQTFCPTLYPLLELGCTSEDWCLQQTIVDKAEALYRVSQGPVLETYSLPCIGP